MTSTPKILNSPSSRWSARGSCWPLGSTLIRGVPPYAPKWTGKDVCLPSCGFPDSGIFSADPILLSLSLGLRSSLLSSQLQWPVTSVIPHLYSWIVLHSCRVSSESIPKVTRHSICILQLHSQGVSSPGSLRDNWSPSLCSCFNHSDFTSTLWSTRC